HLSTFLRGESGTTLAVATRVAELLNTTLERLFADFAPTDPEEALPGATAATLETPHGLSESPLERALAEAFDAQAHTLHDADALRRLLRTFTLAGRTDATQLARRWLDAA